MKKNSEEYIQIFLVSFLKKLQVSGGDFIFWHTPNGGSRNKSEAGKLKLMGTLSGVSDMIILHTKGIEFIELKDKDGKVSKEQKEFLEKVSFYNARTHILKAVDVFDAIEKMIPIVSGINGVTQNGISKSSSSVLNNLSGGG